MPFTPAHAAAALPFRKTRLSLAAVIMGSLSPDFEYFLVLRPHGHFGHTVAGIFLLDLPLSLVFLWLFHRYLSPLRMDKRFGVVVASIVIGALTHIMWDSFTHTSWLYDHWGFLRETIHLPGVRGMQMFKLLQFGSSLLGCIVVVLWWIREGRPQIFYMPPAGWLASIFLFAVVGAIVRVVFFESRHTFARVTIELVVTWIAFLFVGLLCLGFVRRRQAGAEAA